MHRENKLENKVDYSNFERLLLNSKNLISAKKVTQLGYSIQIKLVAIILRLHNNQTIFREKNCKVFIKISPQ